MINFVILMMAGNLALLGFLYEPEHEKFAMLCWALAVWVAFYPCMQLFAQAVLLWA